MPCASTTSSAAERTPVFLTTIAWEERAGEGGLHRLRLAEGWQAGLRPHRRETARHPKGSWPRTTTTWRLLRGHVDKEKVLDQKTIAPETRSSPWPPAASTPTDFPCAEGPGHRTCGLERPCGRAGPLPGGGASYTNQNLCQARSSPPSVHAKVPGASPHHRRRFYENVPRCLPTGLCAKIERRQLWTSPPFFGCSSAWETSGAGYVQHLQHGTGMVGHFAAREDSRQRPWRP